MILKRNALQTTAYVLFCVAAVTTFLSMYTGEGAEEMVENLPSVGHAIIHEHEELAEKFALVVYALGLFSLLSIYLDVKKSRFAKIAGYFTLVLALVAVLLGKAVGTSGGEIRHTEIRSTDTTTSVTQGVESNEADED